jgi:hypothetical protein
MAQSQGAMQRNAERKAQATAFLNQSPEVEYTAKEYATANDMPEKVAANLLSRMAKNKLIKARREGITNFYKALGGGAAKKTRGPAKPKPPRETVAVIAEEIEVVMGKKTIIIGHNPTTGRIRFVVE